MRLPPFGPAAAALVLFGHVLTGCASFGPDGDDGARKLTWFSYVNGEDLRAQCSVEAPDRYRLIYNAQASAQLRTYEVHGEGDDMRSGQRGGAVVEAREIPAADLSRRQPEEALGNGESAASRIRLSPEQFDWLTRSLADSGVFDTPLRGFRTRPGGVLWLASGCHDGAYFLTAFSNPAERLEIIDGRTAAEALSGLLR
ncbi:hypothetical protein [Skermanella pratensis]|uniref:hypothetical protein n=1 Tax=Skermanella pratensis TaxID=2233999 RepID=UPI0013010D3E|nr:hypothetical protein [Skermanella pratensis]